MKAFEITFVDMKLSNRQRRQSRVFRAETHAGARTAFTAALGSGFKAMSVTPAAVASGFSLAALNTRQATSFGASA
jgi:hypothetical protein